MTYSIAFCGIDGAGKTTLIRKVNRYLLESGWQWRNFHQNKFMKHFYNRQKSRTWEWLNHIELRYRNWRWYKINDNLILDRCYICALTYSNLEGFPDIAHKIKPYAFKPNVVILLEPVEELVPNAYEFTKEYRRILSEEGYIEFKRGFHLFGRTTFWKLPDVTFTPLLTNVIDFIGAP